MSAIGPPRDILVAPEDEPRSARLALLGFCTSLALAAVVAVVAWHAFIGTSSPGGQRTIAPVNAVPVAATAVSGPAANAAAGQQAVQPAAPAAASTPATPMVQADADAVPPGLTLRALAQIDPQAPPDTLTVFIVDTAKQAADLEQGLQATNAIRATGGATPLRATAISVDTYPEVATWLTLAQSNSQPVAIVDLR